MPTITQQLKTGLSVTITEDKQADMWETLSSYNEVFGEFECGKCGGRNLRPITRINKETDDKFYELMCMKCFARLAMGVHKKGGTLFPKRKDNETGDVTGEPNGYLPDRGWLKWDPEQKKLV